MKAEALSGRSCGRQNAFLEALRVVKTTSREAFAGKRASFSRLRRAGPPAVPKAELRAGSAGRSAASRRQRTARCPTPRRNATQSARGCPDAGPSGILCDATAPDTEFPDAATRHEPPDAPRSGKKLSRVHPARDALTLAAPRLSPPRRRSTPDAVSLRVSGPVTPHGLAVQRGPWVPAETALLRLRERGCVRDARNVFLRRSRQLPHLVQSRSDRPTGKEKRRDSLSLAQKEGRKAESGGQHAGIPARCAGPGQRRRFRRASGTSSSARTHKTHGVSAESSTSPSASPSRDSRTRTARQHLHAAPTLGHNGSRAAHRQKIFLRLNSKTRQPPKRETGTSPRRKYLTCPAS